MRVRLVNDPATVQRAEALHRQKHGFQGVLFTLLNRLRGRGASPVRIELAPEQEGPP